MSALPDFAAPDVVVEPERCVRRLGVDCSACIDACPVEAVSLASDPITFDEHVCEGCGACRAVCPSEAFGLRTAVGIHEIRSMEDERISIGCTLGGRGSAAASVPCYALLTGAEILYLLAGKESLEFSVEGCDGCRFHGPGLSEFVAMVERVRKLLEDPGRLRLLSSPRWNGMSRRSFLRGLTRTAEDLFFGSLVRDEPFRSPLAVKRWMRAVGLKAPGIDAEAPLEVARLVVAETCTGCGGCAKACPVGALVDESDGLAWAASECTNCDACLVSCPERALSYGGTVTVRESLQPMPLRSFEGCRCPTCGMYFEGHGGTCGRCGEKEALYLERGFDLGIV